MENELDDNNLEKPYYPVKINSYLIPMIIDCFGEEIEKIKYPDGSIEVILKADNNGK